MLQFDIDVKTGIRLREVTLNDAPMIYRAIRRLGFRLEGTERDGELMFSG